MKLIISILIDEKIDGKSLRDRTHVIIEFLLYSRNSSWKV